MPRGEGFKIVISKEEEKTLKMMAGRGKTEQRYARRAMVILFSAEDMSLPEVSKRSGISRQNCSTWRKRFVKEGIDGLFDKNRAGRPKAISVEKRIEVQRLACSKPSDGSNRWSCEKIAKAVGLSAASVCRILNSSGLKPHKISYWCGKSNDPEFEEKKAAIIGLYLNPPENALVLSVDEKSQIQALDRTQPILPMAPGKPKRFTNTYTRYGTTCLLSALAVHDGGITGKCVDSSNHSTFLSFLKHLYRKYPGKHLHIIMDNLSVHKHQEVKEWINRRRRITPHFTPTHSSWLNQIEIWFGIFTRDVIKGGVWHSKKQLVDQIMFYIKNYNEDRAKPFKWTYAA